MGSVVVRRALRSDLGVLLALYEELAGEKLTAIPADPLSAEPRLAEILADPRRELAVATIDGRIIGSADLLVVPNLTHRGEPWAIVENVIVTAAARRSGAGTALMRHLIERARADGCHKVQLLSGKHRTEAHELYRRIGFDAVAEGFKVYFDE
jgi:GNAT superfamily N-acetyltransferase